MSGRFLLDTNIIIGILQGDAVIKGKLDSVKEVFVPSIALGELYYGALKSGRYNDNVNIINDFAATFSGLPCNSITAKYYGEVKKGLKDIGRPIPENDVWIAALAVQHGLVLVSRDKHFTNISGLDVTSWL